MRPRAFRGQRAQTEGPRESNLAALAAFGALPRSPVKAERAPSARFVRDVSPPFFARLTPQVEGFGWNLPLGTIYFVFCFASDWAMHSRHFPKRRSYVSKTA